MAVYDFFTSRNNGSNIDSYIGHPGRLFYSNDTGVIRISDGVTPGGLTIPYTIASDTNVGGIKAGPGVTITSEGQIIIDSANLTFSFGDFVSTVGTYANTNPKAGEDYALLSSVKVNEDVVVASNGDGNILMVGGFQVRATAGNLDASLEAEPIFRVLADGQVRMLVPAEDPLSGAFEIIGNFSGEKFPPNQTGVILHTTGNDSLTNRIYHDASNNYPIVVGRRYNGNVASPTQVLADEVIFRLAGQAVTSDGTFQTFGPAKINWIATEDQGPNNQGGKITVDVTANGTAAFGNVITAVEFTSDGVISNVGFKGNLDATTVAATGNISANLGLFNNVVTPQIVANTVLNVNSGDTITLSTPTNLELYATSGAIYATTPILSVTGNVSAGNISSTTGTFTDFTGKYRRNVRNAGVIPTGGSLVINFATDAIVMCQWGDGFTINYSNYTPGSIVKVMAYKTAGTGTDNLSLDGITPAHVSTGSTTVAGTADLTTFVELICTGTTIGSVYAKI